MVIKQLVEQDAEQFCKLIVNMYSHLENLEWFSPMPYDYKNVVDIINNPRFYVIGAFENDILCAVCSLDYKCGKLIGKINFPQDCDTDKLVEFGFTMVHSDFRGQGIMKKLVAHLIEKTKQDGFEWGFGKVHINNLASSKSLINQGFYKHCDYTKPVKMSEFKSLSSEEFFSEIGKRNAKLTLEKYSDADTEIFVNYHILMKKL